MIVDIKLTLNDFEFNFDKLRDLYRKEPDLIKDKFVLNNRVDWLKVQEHVITNNDQYKEFISDFSSYEIFHSNILINLMNGKNSYNRKIESFCREYMFKLNSNEQINRTNLFVISHALVNNPKRYWDEQTKTINYTELDLFKRLLVLNCLGLLGKNKFGLSLIELFTIHYGIIEVTKEDIDVCLSDLNHNVAVA